MVGEDTEGDVDVFLLAEAFALGRDGASIGLSGQSGDLGEQRSEDVGVVVRGLGGEVGEVLRRRHDASDAFEAHAGIYMFGGERGEGAVGVGVELNENMVPDFDAAGAAGVHAFAAFDFVVGGEQVEMNFGAGSAGAGVAHLPEVVLAVAVDDVDGGIETLGLEELGPDGVGFVVEFGGVPGLGCVNGGVETFGGNAPDLRQQMPAPGERLFLKVVAEGPVAQHFEKGVVVGVVADVLEVVVFAAGADAFLGVGGAGVLGGAGAGPFGDVGLFVTEEDGHELVHAGVGEEESGRVRQERGRRDDRVALGGEEIEEGLADLGGGHRRMVKGEW